MLILFKRASCGGLLDKLIAFFSHSRYAHTEITFDNYTTETFSSDISDGVRFIDKGGTNFWAYDIIQVDLSQESKELWIDAIRWARSQLGKKYDFAGALGFVFPWVKDDTNDWFCSEICTAILVFLKVLPKMSCKILPGGLATHLSNSGYRWIVRNGRKCG